MTINYKLPQQLSVLYFETNEKGEYIVNITRINNHNPVDPWMLSQTESEGRKQAWELYSIKTRIQGFEHAQMKFTGPNIGIRSSRRLRSAYCLTAEDILSTTKFGDGICACVYPICVHLHN